MSTSTFARLPPRLQQAIASRLHWTSLRPVQEQAGAAILDGANVVVLAPTAGGKTEAAVFPVLAQLIERPPEAVGALYIAPIKALLNNQEERLGVYTEMVGLRRFVWHGDAGQSSRRAFVEEPAELLMTTPESLEVMLLSTWVPLRSLLHDLRVVIVDEVHAFAGTDRGAHLTSVLERITRHTPNDIQRIGLSATVGNPDEILHWLAGSSQRPCRVIDPTAPPTPRRLSVMLRPTVPEIARAAAVLVRGSKSLFFCQSRALTEAVAQRMQGQGTDVYVHHSSVSLEERHAAEERFHHGSDACVVATSTLELGIDVGDLDLVLQANAPSTVSSFLQRMGRTGRRPGQTANTTFLCENVESVLQAVALIELAREHWVEPVDEQRRCWPVLAHQILALTLQYGAVEPQAFIDLIERVPDLSGISQAELDELLDHMVASDHLFLAAGRYSMGERAERIFGRRNFMELYAVFSSPVLYRVLTTSRHEVGSLEQAFVDQLVEEMSSFLLGGRAWSVDRILHSERQVLVHEAPRGRKPRWGGFIPQILSRRLCQKIREILSSDVVYPYLDRSAAEALDLYREELAGILSYQGTAIRIDADGAHWWTFAGGRINHTLKHAIEWLTGWKVVADNLHLRIADDTADALTLETTLAQLRAPDFWTSPTTRQALLDRLPAYRLSKLQVLLPDRFSAEVVGQYLLDLQGTEAWLTGAVADPARPSPLENSEAP